MPSKAYSWLGKVDSWDLLRYQFLKSWLGTLGIPSSPPTFHPPDKTPILDALSDPGVVAYIANAHGDSYHAEIIRYVSEIQAMDVESVLGQRKMKFSFLIHSAGMNDDQGANTWSYVLRNGEGTGTVVIGVRGDLPDRRGMPAWKWFLWQIYWANLFFAKVAQGRRFKEAFDATNEGFKLFTDNMVFNGDESLSIKDLKDVEYLM